MRFVLTILLLLGQLVLPAAALRAETAQSLYSSAQDRIFQIRLIELASGSKAAIGSGFQISADGILATNYHVVAEAVNTPEKYRLEFVDTQGRKGNLELLDIDVIHDLALVRHREADRAGFLALSQRSLAQGEDLFSMGNPHDLGMTVANGTYNGLLEHSFYERILFSGSINPGMSGGPTVNRQGEVVGVNVATAGNQLSFLVPVQELATLLESSQSGNDTPFKQRITEQLQTNQQRQMQALLDDDWPLTQLGDARVAGEIASFTRCWGGSSDEEKARYTIYYSRCFSEDNLYLSEDLSTGQINYEFYWLSSDSLNPWQFYSRYQNSLTGAMPVNSTTATQLGNFQCQSDFVATRAHESSPPNKSILCVRHYKHHPGIYDLLYIAASLGKDNSGLISHFAIAGVSKELGLAFTRRFMEHVRWN